MKHRSVAAKKRGWNPEDMMRAVDEVLKNNMSERKASQTFNIKRTTLIRKLKEACSRSTGLTLNESIPYRKTAMKIFTTAEEIQLVQYCLSAAKMD